MSKRLVNIFLLWFLATVATGVVQWQLEHVRVFMVEVLHPEELVDVYISIVVTVLLHGMLLAIFPIVASLLIKTWVGWISLVSLVFLYLTHDFAGVAVIQGAMIIGQAVTVYFVVLAVGWRWRLRNGLKLLPVEK